jgi:hypothetical protein
VLDDGVYEALVVDVDDLHDNDVVVVHLTIVAAEHKGDVVAVRVAGRESDPLALLGVPATLTVRDGEPSIAFED